MSAVLQQPEARFEPMALHHLDAVVHIEQQAYEHPWMQGNFQDALQSGYQAQVLWAGDVMLGYFIAMRGVDEVHLLNITVVPQYQRQGWARVMLDALAIWSRGQGVQWVWLEVRVGNTRAMHIYEQHGYRRVGQRKGYYPAGEGRREDALVMSLRL